MLISSVLIVRKSYEWEKYFSVLLIVTGVVLFTYKKDYNSCEGDLHFLYGNFLLGISLLMDGFTSAAQDVMRKNSKPSTLNFMIFNNAWSSLMSIVVLIAIGEGRDFVYFCIKFPTVVIYLGIILSAGFCGQFFISSIILSFGSLPCSIVTTLRKFSTVLLSILIFQNNLTLQQWIATGIIFSALTLDIFFLGTRKHTETSDMKESTADKKIDVESSGGEKTQT